MKQFLIVLFALICICLPLTALANDYHIVLLGDSNTSISGDDCDKPIGWGTWFKETFQPASIRSYARSGSTWTNTASTKYNVLENISILGNDNVVYNQVNRLKMAFDAGEQPVPDVIIVAAGTNDAWFMDRRPGAFSVDSASVGDIPLPSDSCRANEVLTLAESVLFSCGMLQSYFPTTKIILLTPMQTTVTDLSRIYTVGDIIQACANRLGIDCIRQDSTDFLDAIVEKKKKTKTSDGTHTNEFGAKQNGTLLASLVMNILKKQ